MSRERWTRPLTPRQRAVAALMAEGLANKEIAGRLGIALSTVKAHAQVLFNRMGARNRCQAAVRYTLMEHAEGAR